MNHDSRTAEFLALYTSCQRQLYVYVRSHIGSASDIDDVLQEISAVLWEKFDRYRPGESFVRWAFGIARLEVLKHREKHGRMHTGLDADLLDLVAAEMIETSETADLLSTALRGCLQKLPPLSRVVLRQRFEGNKSVKEIAKNLHRTESTVYKTLSGIYDVLYECVQAELSRRDSP